MNCSVVSSLIYHVFSFLKWLFQFQIGELANTLTSKMEFLGIDKKAISNFQLLLLQTEVDIIPLTSAGLLFSSRLSQCRNPFTTIIWSKFYIKTHNRVKYRF